MQRIFLLATGLLLCTCAFSQRVRLEQSFGIAGTQANVSGTRDVLDTLRTDYSLRVRTYGLTYAPRVDLFGTKDFSVSIAAPMMFGYSSTSKYRSIDVHPSKKDTVENLRGVHWAFEVPVIADFNFGLRSASEESRRNFGFFAGIGYIYTYTKIKATGGMMPFDRWEPICRAGIRMGSAWEKRWSIVFNIRGKLEGGAQKTYGLQVVKEL